MKMPFVTLQTTSFRWSSKKLLKSPSLLSDAIRLSSLVQLAGNDPSIVVTGRVDDVRPYMEKAAVYVVPIRIGGGTRLKIYEAMAMEKPIVSTTIGAEGLPLRNGKELLLADTAESFAESIVKLLHQPGLARTYRSKRSGYCAREFWLAAGGDTILDNLRTNVR